MLKDSSDRGGLISMEEWGSTSLFLCIWSLFMWHTKPAWICGDVNSFVTFGQLKQHTVGVLCHHNVCDILAASVQYPHSICSIPLQYLSNILTVFVRYPCSICPLSSQYFTCPIFSPNAECTSWNLYLHPWLSDDSEDSGNQTCLLTSCCDILGVFVQCCC